MSPGRGGRCVVARRVGPCAIDSPFLSFCSWREQRQTTSASRCRAAAQPVHVSSVQQPRALERTRCAIRSGHWVHPRELDRASVITSSRFTASPSAAAFADDVPRMAIPLVTRPGQGARGRERHRSALCHDADVAWWVRQSPKGDGGGCCVTRARRAAVSPCTCPKTVRQS